ncbi:MAG TPA: putative transporter [Fibrobacteraceae bacterium]|nr:putative transporter [Fibrobacteraceae bacterium]
MNWIRELIYQDSVAHTLILLSCAVFPGIWLGNRSFLGIKLGIAGVLFSGLAVGATGLPLNPQVLHFVREFGLILFVFAVGLQVGPGFFANFRDQGLRLNLYATTIVLLGVAIAAVEKFALGIPVEAMVGVLSGAVTNTPGLGAAQQSLHDLPGLGDTAGAVSGTGYAVAYPFGIFGIILTMLLVRWIFRVRIEDEAKRFELERQQGLDIPKTFTVQLRNPLLQGKTLAELIKLLDDSIVVSRLGHQGHIHTPLDTDTLETNDLLQIVCSRNDLNKVTSLVGSTSDQDLRQQPSGIAVRQILVSRPQVSRQNLEHLRAQERLGVRITRVLRSGIEFVPDRDTHLHVGDQITAVGPQDGLKSLSQEFGDSRSSLEHPNLLPVFLGILCGVLLGSIPIAIPGLPAPVKLGLAGGPLVVALLMGFKRRLGPVQFYLPSGGGQFMREIGILLFLAAVGLGSGPSFVQALGEGSGWFWMASGVAITLLPLLLVGLWARWRGCNYLTLSGMLAGSMTDPPALGYANSLSGSPAQSVAYASVYPVTMFLRVVTAQLFVILLS